MIDWKRIIQFTTDSSRSLTREEFISDMEMIRGNRLTLAWASGPVLRQQPCILDILDPYVATFVAGPERLWVVFDDSVIFRVGTHLTADVISYALQYDEAGSEIVWIQQSANIEPTSLQRQL